MNEYKQEIASLFDAVSTRYPEVFAHFGQVFIEKLPLTPEMNVLDIAAGRGALLFPAAEKAGYVTGIDISPQMVQTTTQEIQKRGLNTAEMRVMDAEHLDFPDDSFDMVLCGYALSFFDPVETALAEMRRVLKPNDLLGIITWGKFDERWKWIATLMKQYMPPDFEYPRLWRAPGFLSKPEEVEALVRSAGFRDIQIFTEETEIVYQNAEAWWEFHYGFGARLPLSILSAQALARYKAEALAKLAELKQDNGYPQRYIAHLTLARK